MPRETADLFRLVYRSHSALVGSAALVRVMMEEIIESSQRRNADAGITGALVYTQSLFVQALEGPALAVEAAFDRICCDLRHRKIEVAEYGPVLERGFGSWSMRLVRPDEPSSGIDDRGEGAESTNEFAATTMKLMAVLLRTSPTPSAYSKPGPARIAAQVMGRGPGEGRGEGRARECGAR